MVSMRMVGGPPPKNLDNFPKDWIDPLELYGNLLQELIAPGHDLGVDRKNVKALIAEFIAKTGENVKVKRFNRYVLGE